VRVGITAMLTDRSVRPDELACAAENLGFTSLLLPEHTHLPLRSRDAHPLEERVPDDYARTLDPFVALAMAAGVTETLVLGTGIALLPVRDTLLTAKEVATLDHLSGGRVVLGIGAGWNLRELADHGIDVSTRRAKLREQVAAMRTLWRDEVAAFEGEHVAFEPSLAWPKPVAGTVPIWLGVGGGPRGLADVASVADVWAPHGASGLAEALPRLAAACEAHGRDPASVRTVPVGTRPTAGKLDHLATLGVDEVVVLLPDAGRDAALAELARTADVVDDWRGGAPAPDDERAGTARPSPTSHAAPVGARRSTT
jgi:probable F420-dependent oxidoreductase